MRQDDDNSFDFENLQEHAKTHINFNPSLTQKLPEDLSSLNDIEVLRQEIYRLRTESRGFGQRLKVETESKKKWESISRQREKDLLDQQKQNKFIKESLDTEKKAHVRTQNGLRLKTERLKIVEAQQQKDRDKVNKNSDKKDRVKQAEYTQATFIVTDNDLAKGNGKDSVLSNMKQNNSVAFPERRGSRMQEEHGEAEKDPAKMSRIELLRAGLANKAPFM